MVKATTNSKKDSFGIYLKDIGKYDILTKDQEIELARSVQAMIHLMAIGESYSSLEDKIAACGCTKKEYERIMYKGSKAKQLMILHNLKLVVSIAKRYSSRGVDIEDLVQEGNIGLNRAVEKFNPELGYKLSTYACVPTTTLILTQRGWTKWNNVKEDDKTLGYDEETQTLRWTQIEKVTQYKSAPLLRFGNKHWSTLCTANHKWVMKDKDNSKLKPIESWADKEHSLVLCAPYCEGESDIGVDKAVKMARLYAPFNKRSEAMHIDEEHITLLMLKLKPEARRAFIETWFEEGGNMTPALELSLFLEGDNSLGDKITNKNAYVLDEKEGEVWCPSTGLESWVAKDEKGNIFITGNTWWIKQAIARAVATHSRSIRLPVHIYDLLNKMKRTARELSQKRGRQATLQEIAEHLNINYDKLRKLSLFTKNVLSFDASNVDSENSTVLNEYSNYIVGAEVRETYNEIRNRIMYILSQLTERERRIVVLRYGLDSDKPYTYKDISIEMGVSIPTVRTICNNLKDRFKELGELDPQDFPDYHIELTTDSFMLS